MAFEIGGPQYGLRDGKIGTWDGDGTYSNTVDIYGIRLLGVQLNVTSNDAKGDDAVLATATRVEKATVRLAFLSVQANIIEVISGVATIESGVTKSRQKVSTKNPPYVGVAGQAFAEELNGDCHLFVPKCKMTEGFEVRFELDAFSIPELTLTAVPDALFLDAESYPVLFVIDQNSTHVNIALPPPGM